MRTTMKRVQEIKNRKVICGPVERYHEIWIEFEKYAQKIADETKIRPSIGDPIFYNNKWFMVEKQ